MRVETDTLPPLVELGRKLLTKAQEGDADGVKDLMQQGAPFTTDWVSSVVVVGYNVLCDSVRWEIGNKYGEIGTLIGK